MKKMIGKTAFGIRLTKMLLYMKLTTVFLFAGMMTVFGSTYSQSTKLNLKMQQSTLEQLFGKVEEQSEFYFFYKNDEIDLDLKVDVIAENKTIDKILDQAFEGTGLNYRILDRYIVISKNPISDRQMTEVVQQTLIVQGTVKNRTGELLPGVTVVIKGTSSGTVTGADGTFTLNTNGSDILVFSFIGMKTQEVPVSNRRTINVEMDEETIGIEEVVAIGYGTQKRRDITGSVVSVKGELLNEIPSSSVEQTLVGRAAGVHVTQGSGIPGAGASIRIRGVGTVNNAEPLYIIDGIILGNLSSGGQTSVSPLSMLNPNDIESIDILKDASATAIYGARAGNGVVIITTKKGTVGKINITFNSYAGVNKLQIDKIEMMDGPEWANYYNNVRISNNQAEYPGKEFVQSVVNGTDYETWKWTDYGIRNGVVQNYDLSLNSGSEKSQIYASLNYFDQTGIMINSDLKRYAMRLNSDHKINDRLKFGQTLTISRTSANTVGNLDANNNTRDWIRRLLLANPYKRPYAEDGDYAGTSDFYVPELDHDNEHALWDLEQRYSRNDNSRLWASVYGEWEIIKDLKFKSSLSVDWSTMKSENRVPNQYIEGNATTDTESNTLSFNQSDNQNWFIENTLTWNKTINAHKITALAGYQAQNGLYRGFGAGKSYFVNTDYWFFNRPQLMTDITDSQGNIITSIPRNFPSVSNYQNESAVVSWFGRLIYSFNDKYLLTATLRHDASSKFGANKRWGTFPAINAGWRIKEESFMQGVEKISNLKLRAGYGISGSDNVPNYQFQSTVGGGADFNYVFNEGLVEGYNLARLANPFLQWEEIVMLNFGIDAGFFNNRLEITIDGFKKNTEKLFLTFAPPMEVGLEGNPNGNLGEVQNIGLEFDIRGDILTNGPLKWNSSLNFSTIKNEVISLAADGADRYNGANITRVGEEIGAIYGYVMDGLFQNWDEVYNHAYQNQATTGVIDENGKPVYDTSKKDMLAGLNFTAPGDIRFKDLNGDGIIEGENDRAIIGSTIPDFIWGLNNDLSYKGLTLSLFFQGVHGVDLYNSLKVGQETTGGDWSNKRRTLLNAWSGEGTSSDMQRLTISDPNNNTRTSSRYVEDGSYVRLKNVRLSFDLPEKWILKTGMNQAQIYVNATNLLTITKYTGYDPEIGLRNGGNPETAGVDAGVYPVTSMFTGGIKVTF
jgi:TonB-linked SusC/RagA family outer membrane protein